MVVCLRWNIDDSEIVSCGTRGAIYKWRVNEEKRTGETVFKKVAWNSLGITPDARNIFAVGSDCTVRWEKRRRRRRRRRRSPWSITWEVMILKMSRTGKL